MRLPRRGHAVRLHSLGRSRRIRSMKVRALLFALLPAVAGAAPVAETTNDLSGVLRSQGYVEIRMESCGAGQLCVPFRIKGREVFFLVDTGSSFSLIDKDLAKELEIPLNTRRTVEMVEMNGGRREHRVTAPLLVYVGTYLLPPQELAVAELEKVSVETKAAKVPEIRGIVGSTILRRHSAIIDCGKRRLYLTGTIGSLDEKL